MSGHSVPPTAWTTGLCDCCSDCKSCWLVFCCPCVALGQVAETLDKGATSCGLAGTIYAVLMLSGAFFVPLVTNLYSCTYRRKLRAWYGLPEEPCSDCCVHFWCEPCALCQMYRELKNRGANPADGPNIPSTVHVVAELNLKENESDIFDCKNAVSKKT